jgi:general stress protein YciG
LDFFAKVIPFRPEPSIDRQREIASKGGKSVPAEKRSFSQDRELASEAGRKGGQASGSTRNNQE